MSLNTPQPSPMGLRVAQAVGITLSAYLLGQNGGLSYITTPALMQAPAALATRQWEQVYLTGRKVAVPMALASMLATGFAASYFPRGSRAFQFNLTAALIFPSIIPFTLFVMQPTNAALQRKRAELAAVSVRGGEGMDADAEAATTQSVNALLDKWATLNLVRAVFIGAGCGCAVFALLG